MKAIEAKSKICFYKTIFLGFRFVIYSNQLETQ